MPKISSLEDSNFTNFFPSKFQQIDITSVSGHCRRARFVWKICQTVAGIKNNLSLSNLFFGGFFAIWPECESQLARSDKWAGLLYALITTSRTISHECVVAA